MEDVIIVGGGAAGLACAVALKRAAPHMRVTLLEANREYGKKIRISGNGRCNIGNRNISPKRYFSAYPDFVAAALQTYDASRIESFLKTLGIILVEEKEGKLFPYGKQAAFVADTLIYEAQNIGVALLSDCHVSDVISLSQGGFELQSNIGKKRCRILVLATGSPAAPQLGGNTSGLKLAQTLGHRMIDPLPALVQLTLDSHPYKRAAGVRVDAALTLFLNGEKDIQTQGDVLFTDYGISGLATLDISPYVSLALHKHALCEIEIDLFPTMSMQALRNFLNAHIDTTDTTPALLMMQRFLPKKLADAILRQHGWHHADESFFTRKRIQTLAYTLKHLRLHISGTRGFKGAEVALGGVDTREIDPHTMASLRCEGLYIVGEALDVAGDRGGFNFHFAFTSALRAAETIAALSLR